MVAAVPVAIVADAAVAALAASAFKALFAGTVPFNILIKLSPPDCLFGIFLYFPIAVSKTPIASLNIIMVFPLLLLLLYPFSSVIKPALKVSIAFLKVPIASLNITLASSLLASLSALASPLASALA